MTASRYLRKPRGPGVLLMGALLAVTLVAGCDQTGAHTKGESEAVFDLRPLFLSAQQERCVSVVDRLILTVTEADGEEQVVVRQLAVDDAEVRVPVRVNPGSVRFDAAVRSNDGTLLYSGTRRVDVTPNGFRVEVNLDAVNAVLMACPELVPLVLVPDGGGYRGGFRLINRGVGTVSWVATSVTPLCGRGTFLLQPCAATAAAGSDVLVSGSASSNVMRPYEIVVRITSEVGTLDVRFATDPARPAPPSALLGDPRALARPGLLAEGLRQRLLSPSPAAMDPWTPSP
jgi:hypothetical protein